MLNVSSSRNIGFEKFHLMSLATRVRFRQRVIDSSERWLVKRTGNDLNDLRLFCGVCVNTGLLFVSY